MNAASVNLRDDNAAVTRAHLKKPDERDKWLRMAIPFAMGAVTAIFTSGRVSSDITNHLADHDRQLIEVRQLVQRQSDDEVGVRREIGALQVQLSAMNATLNDIREIVKR